MSALKAVALVLFLAQLSEILGHPQICGNWVLVRRTQSRFGCVLDSFTFKDVDVLYQNEEVQNYDFSSEGQHNEYELRRVDDNGMYLRVNDTGTLNITTFGDILKIGERGTLALGLEIVSCYVRLSPAVSPDDEEALNQACPLEPEGRFVEQRDWRTCLEKFNQRYNN